MAAKREMRLVEVFKAVPNPRRGNAERHSLNNILVIALCGMICGANEWTDIAEWGHSHQAWLEQFLELPNGTPSHDTFGRVFGLLDPAAYEASLLNWIREMVSSVSGQQVCLDGKEIRRSQDRYQGRQAIQTVSAWLAESGLVLGQLKVPKKGQEISTVQDLLGWLELSGCVVTADALHCQTETARLIVERGADYVLPVKGNQRKLRNALRDLFAYETERKFVGVKHTVFEELHKGHGRLETRRYTVVHDPSYIDEINPKGQWWQLSSVVMVERIRQTGKTFNKRSRQVTYGISSLKVPARRMAAWIRQHWEIENRLHWRLDVIFREDLSRVRQNNAALNMAALRRLSLGLLQRETSLKRGIQGKRLKAAWDPDYLLKVLLTVQS